MYNYHIDEGSIQKKTNKSTVFMVSTTTWLIPPKHHVHMCKVFQRYQNNLSRSSYAGVHARMILCRQHHNCYKPGTTIPKP